MSSTSAPQQHKQPSRKGKKAWRKNVDVNEIHDGLEGYREEVRAGGPLREKPSEDIFALDTTGSGEISKKYNLQKPLKIDEILARRSAVPAIDSRKRSELSTPSGIYEPASKRRRGDWVSKKDMQRLKKTTNAVSHLPNDAAVEEAISFDLWDKPHEVSKIDDLDYVSKPQVKVAPTTIKRVPIAMTASGKPVKAVSQPAASNSYNPDYEEWNDLIVREGDKEFKAEQMRLRAEQDEAERQARIDAMPDDEAGGRTDDESAWEGFETENEEIESLRKKRPTRKNPAEKNKAKRKKAAERLAKHESKMANRKKNAEELAALLSRRSGASNKVRDLIEMDAEAGKQLQEEVETTQDDTAEITLRRRRLGNAPIPQKNLEVVLPDELRDSLRLLKPEGNLLQDRFRNLLVNGKIESRKPIVQPKKKKVKYTEKWSFKDFGIQV